MPLTPEIALDCPKISPDGTRIAGYNAAHKVVVISASGGTPEICRSLPPRFRSKWSSDSNRLLIHTEDQDGSPLLEWVDLKSGRATPWQKLRGSEEEKGTIGMTSVSLDEKTYVYSYHRRLSELFVVDGWK